MALKLTTENVKQIFEPHGYVVVGPYVNSKTPVEVKCPAGHTIKMRIGNFVGNGRRCLTCHYENYVSHNKLSADQVRTDVEAAGYKMLGIYTRICIPFLAVCPKGHRVYVRYDHFRNGHRCNACLGKQQKTFDEVHAAFKVEGWTILDSKYMNSGTPMNALCPSGHQTTKSWDAWKCGQRCRICAGIVKKTPEERAAWRKHRYDTIPAIKLRTAVHNSMKRALGGGVKAGRHWEDLVGYKIGVLLAHIDLQLKPEWNWGNHGKVWHIDHIRPVKSFDFSGPDQLEQIRKCWALDNLRPLFWFDNESKGARYEATDTHIS